MFGSIDKSKGLLFVTHDLDHSIRLTMEKMRQEVEGLDQNRLLNTPPEDLKNYLVEKYGITPITMLRDQWYADHQDAPVDVRHDRMRWIEDRSRPAMVAGERVEVRIPFEGENYGDRYRHGEPIASGFVESAVNQVVSKRFVKRQQMAWRPRHAHNLLQIRTAVLNNQLRSYVERWYPSIAGEEDHRLAA